MKPLISILALLTVTILFSNCTTAYKTGQTPDDVYFSPTRPQDEYVRVNNNYDDQKYNGDDYYDDRYLRMKVHNPRMWSDLDDWYYYGDRYNYAYNPYNNYDLYFMSNSWNPYRYWNNYYNPYYYNYVIVNPKVSYTYTAPRKVNLNTYNNMRVLEQNYNNSKNSGKLNINNKNRFSSGNTNQNTGSFLRNIFSGGNSSGNTGNTSTRSSSSSSSSSGSSSSSSAPVRKF